MATVHDLSWNETSFGSKLQLFLKSQKSESKRIHSGNPQVRSGGHSALSSTYYSIVGTAFFQLKARAKLKWNAPFQMIVWCLTWLPLSLWCYIRMLSHSNYALNLVGYRGLSADQCDVRQSILCVHGDYEEAEKCIRIGLEKMPEIAHTRGLLYLGLAIIYSRKGLGKKGEMFINLALDEAADAEGRYPLQAVRIYKGCAKISQDQATTTLLRQKARALAEVNGASDQLLKL